MSRTGRPPKPIDWNIFEQLCHIQCTHDEISSFCHISKAALYERVKKEYKEDFPTIYKRFSDGGKSSLRRRQFQMSEKNPAMCIWLGKQYLDQREPQALEKNSTPVNDLTITQLIDALHAHKVKKDAKDEAKADAPQQ